ncbi:hypothetical protein, partial [Legionella maceachernii]
NLNNQETNLHQAALNCLATIAPFLDKETLTTFVDLVINNLNNPDSKIRETALNCLTAIVPALEKEMVATLVESIKNKLNASNSTKYVRQAALNCLTVMIPALNKEILNTLVEPVINKLNDVQSQIRQTASHLLVFLLANPDNNLKIEIDSTSLNTSEALLIHAVSGWISQIHQVATQAEVAMQPEHEDPPMNRL